MLRPTAAGWQLAVTFSNTRAAIPGWVDNIHVEQPRSYAYRKGDSAVSLFGRAHGLYTLSPGLTVSQRTDVQLATWAGNVFGASTVADMLSAEGRAVEGVWRPGLYYLPEINQALNVTDEQRLAADQALGILMEKLYDLFLYVEPTVAGLNAFGHRTRELLILAATEVENSWRRYCQQAGLQTQGGRYTTNDYVRLNGPLYLGEYRVRLKPFGAVGDVAPFAGWAAAAPTQSLGWYNAYNLTKHNREAHFGEASLIRCIEAVSACIVMFAVRFSPFTLLEGRAVTSSLFNQLFDVGLVNPDPTTFYVPDIDITGRRPDLVCGDGTALPWTRVPLVLP